MRCADLALRVSRAADSGLDPEADPVLAEHMRSCPTCRDQLRALQQAEAILSSAPLLTPDATFGQRVMAGVALERARLVAQRDPVRRLPRVALLAAGSALAFVASGVILVGAALAWNPETLARLAVQSLVLVLVQGSGMLASADAISRAVMVLWSALPAPVGQAILGAAGCVTLSVVFCWTWLVSRYGWSARASIPGSGDPSAR